MKRTIFGLATILVVIVTVFAVLVLRPVRKVKAGPAPCSVSTLMGDYGWTEFGMEPEQFPAPFWTQTGLAHFDGSGNFSESKIYYIENGRPDSGNPSSITGGTYTVDSDCTVTICYIWQGETYTDHGVVVGTDGIAGYEVIAEESSKKKDTTGHVDIKRVLAPAG